MKNENTNLMNYYIYITGQFVSQFGSKMTSYALTLWMYKQSGSVLSTAVLLACYLVPEIFLNFIAGSIIDKINKKNVILMTDMVAALASCSILWLLSLDLVSLYWLYLVNIILGISDAFQSPASEVVPSLIVAKEDYIKISGIQSFSQSFISIFNPIVTTAIYSFFGLYVVVWIDLLSFLFAFITLALFVKIPEITTSDTKKESFLEISRSGFVFIKQTTGLKEVILFMAFINLIVAIYNTNLAPMVLSRTNQNDLLLGMVSSMIGVSGIIGSFFVARSKDVKNRTKLATSIIAYSFLICNTLLGIGQHYLIWMIAVFLGNVMIPVFSAQISYLMRVNVPYSMQGRVFSMRNTLQYSVIPIGNLLGGFLSDHVFEPFMKSNSNFAKLAQKLVGTGTGSGIGLLFVVLGLLGYVGSILFKKNKQLQKLNR